MLWSQMMDLVYIAVIVLFFSLIAGLAIGCKKLEKTGGVK
jgi:hypothetical protein